jgi:SHS2 domain-containing protein
MEKSKVRKVNTITDVKKQKMEGNVWKNTWNSLDYNDGLLINFKKITKKKENATIKFSKEVEKILEKILESKDIAKNRTLQKKLVDDENDFHISEPFTVEKVAKMLAHFKDGGRVRAT